MGGLLYLTVLFFIDPISLWTIYVLAQKLVQDIQYPAVERVDDFAALKWRRMTAKKGRTKLYYPCLVIPDDEARLIFDDDIPPSKTAIKYLGKFWKGATTMELVIRTTLFGIHPAKRPTMTEEELSTLNLLDQSDEEILSIFLNQEFPKQNDQQQAVRRRAEELVFQKTLDIVRRNQLAKEATKRQEEEELNQLVAKPTTEGLVGHSKSANRRKQAESDDDDVHEDGVISCSVPFSPDSIKKRVFLRPGDVVEYYETNRVFGRADARRVSTIIGIDPRGNFPINLESGDPLQIDDRIRRIQKVFKGRLVDDTESTFRCVRNYGLRAAGTMKNVAAQRMVNKAKQLRTEYDATIEQHWTNQDEGCDGGDQNSSPPVDVQQAEKTHTTTTTTTMSFANNWHKKLSHQIEVEEETMKKKRRYTPRITPSELQLVMKTWSLLENKIKQNGTEFTDDQATRILAQELSISEHRACAILQGDPKAWLSQRDKDEILEALGIWVEEEGQSSL
jgi:hypothetical protein